MQELSSGIGITPLESGGFGSWQRITILAQGIAEALGAPLMIAAVYDRDYFCHEQIEEITQTLGANREEIPTDMRTLLEALEAFRTSRPPT